MRTVILDKGVLVLRSEKSEALVTELMLSGTFWEYVSEMFEEKVNPKTSQITEEALKRVLLDTLAQQQGLIIGNGGVVAHKANNTPTSDVGQESKPVVSKSLDLSKISGKGMDLLMRMNAKKGEG